MTYTGLVDVDARNIEIIEPTEPDILTVKINDNARKTIQPGSKVSEHFERFLFFFGKFFVKAFLVTQ